VSLAIGEVAEAAGLATSAIRYYEKVGLLPPAERVSGRRRYPPLVLTRLRLIEVAKRAGFTLAEIQTLMTGFGEDVPPSRRWAQLAERKLAEVDALIGRAEGMRALLQQGLRCQCLRPADCDLL
jgi:MerR family redox-sensitive transcriptional activator SoxR